MANLFAVDRLSDADAELERKMHLFVILNNLAGADFRSRKAPDCGEVGDLKHHRKTFM